MRAAAGWTLPGAGLVLVPKCPMCVAAYLALGGMAGVSLATAAHLRIVALVLCWAMLTVLGARLALRFARRPASLMSHGEPHARRALME